MDLDQIRVMGILGDIHTAKTNLLFYIIRNYKGSRSIILYGYPKKVNGYKQVSSLQELSLISNKIVVMDELQKHIKFYQRSTSEEFLELLSTMAHNNNTIIFTTPMSQYITKQLDCFVDGFCYTRLKDLSTLKNGSKAKRRLLQFSSIKINKWSLSLKNGEYIEIIDTNDPNDNGFKKFPDQHIEKDWNTNISPNKPQNKSKKMLNKKVVKK